MAHLTEEKPMDLLRFTTAGSVDDGKSSLIGRLLYDTKSIFEDQLEAIERASEQLGDGQIQLALLTDGLRAEREQKITIDVAYRYFATPRRKFIIADTPGHIQYTRNMVTGASTADLAIILVDARKGLQTQSRRHAYISSLLGIKQLVLAVNKMDLVEYSQIVFDEIEREFRDYTASLGGVTIQAIPISALYGDNVVDAGDRIPWYTGPTLLKYLDEVSPPDALDHLPFRMAVQYVIRPHQDFRGLAGRVGSGTIRLGETLQVLPSKRKSVITAIDTFDGQLKSAQAGDSVVISLADDLDISRGDTLVSETDPPQLANGVRATVAWMHEEPLRLGQDLIALHGSQFVKAQIQRFVHAVNIDDLSAVDTDRLSLNEIGVVEVVFGCGLPVDPYSQNRATGGFVLIDPDTNVTVGACMVESALHDSKIQNLAFRTVRAQQVSVVNLQVAEALRSEIRSRGQAAVIVGSEFAAVAPSIMSQDVFVIVLDPRGLESRGPLVDWVVSMVDSLFGLGENTI